MTDAKPNIKRLSVSSYNNTPTSLMEFRLPFRVNKALEISLDSVELDFKNPAPTSIDHVFIESVHPSLETNNYLVQSDTGQSKTVLGKVIIPTSTMIIEKLSLKNSGRVPQSSQRLDRIALQLLHENGNLFNAALLNAWHATVSIYYTS